MDERPCPDLQLTPARHRADRPAVIPRLAGWLFRRLGWRLTGELPADAKLILVVGPHTSNWDFAVGVLAMLALDIRLHFLAKHSLFVPPLGPIMRTLGGLPIDRGRAEGFAHQTARRLREADELILVITPEGTRSPVDKLKTGFSRIAGDVPCPMVPVLFDYGRREVQLLAPRGATSPERDAETFRALFATATPKNPANF